MRFLRDRPAGVARARIDGRGRGFSVVELLVTLAVALMLLSLLLVGLGAAVRNARIASTAYLMDSLAQGLARFRADVGYLPPVLADPGLMPDGSPGALPGTLGWSRDGVAPPALPPADDPYAAPRRGDWGPNDRLAVQAWCSTTSLAEYLIGPGDRSQDGFGVITAADGALPASIDAPGCREQPTLGIRDPGPDGLWGAATDPRDGFPPDGRFRSRGLAAVTPAGAGDPVEGNGNVRSPRQDPARLTGPRLGPYVDASSRLELGGLVAVGAGGMPVVARLGEAGYSDTLSKVLLDPFGMPIVYYRRPYLGSDLRSIDRRYSLADVIPLRPAVFGPGEAIDAAPDAAGDGSASRAAAAAEFALFSFGPDRSWHALIRADPDGRNQDNVVHWGG